MRNNKRIQYHNYQFTKREWIRSFAVCVLAPWSVNLLFYQSFWAFLPIFPISCLYFKYRKLQLIRKRKQVLHYQFKDALGSLSAALRAGYSLENAIGETWGDMLRLYGKEADITKEFCYLSAQLGNRIPVENLLRDFGDRSGVEDIYNFAEILSAAKRNGGNVARILERSAQVLEGKIEARKEIDAAVAARKLEHKIMSAMPAGIILYMQYGSPGFLNALYGNWLGVCVMTLCLGGYAAGYLWGKKVVDIEI